MITDVAFHINKLDLPKSTKANALALLEAVHPENGHAVLSWDDLSEMFGGVDKRVARRHLGAMQKADLIHYSSNGDALVYLNFKAWLAEKRALSTLKTCTEDTKNVHSEHEKRALSAPAENDTNESARVDARKTCTESTKNARGRALTYTHVRAQNDGLTDPDPIDGNSQSIPPSPEEQMQSLALLRAIRVSPPKAAALAELHPFERVRCCVASWWMNRQAMGGKLQNGPGMVVHWLDEWPRVEPNTFDEREWQRTELYLDHRTAAELAEDVAPPPTPLEPLVVIEAQPPPYLDDDPAWLAVASDPGAAGELSGLVEVTVVDGVPLYRLQARDPVMAQMLDNRMAARLQKVIKGAVGYPVQVEIIGDDDGKRT